MPKYPNKKKRKHYWKRYFRANIKNYRKVWNFLDELIKEKGVAFRNKRRGRKPKHSLAIYTKLCIFIGYFHLTIDEAAGLLDLLENKTLDRSNVDRWFIRFNKEYARVITNWLHNKIEAMFPAGDYITDGTKITTDRYKKKLVKGEETYVLRLMGLCILVMYFASVGMVSIVNFHTMTGDAHESPPFRNYLLERVKLRKRKRVHGDKGFDAEENFEKIYEKGLIPNIVPKEGSKKGFYRHKARKDYSDKLRKAIRGLVEVVFGGMETETNNRVRFRKDRARKNYIALRALSHEIRTYFRAIAHKTIAYLKLFRNNLPLTKKYISKKILTFIYGNKNSKSNR